MKLFLVLCLFGSLAVAWRPSWVPPIWDESCTFGRNDAFACITKYIDVSPKNDQITKSEIDAAIATYAPAYVRALSWFVGTEKVFSSCDYNKDGVLTPRDWKLSGEHCLPHKRNLCTMQWFCNRAASKS
jgi:hypothetical protein